MVKVKSHTSYIGSHLRPFPRPDGQGKGMGQPLGHCVSPRFLLLPLRAGQAGADERTGLAEVPGHE